MRGSAPWLRWRQWNEDIFLEIIWTAPRLQQTLWKCLINHGQVDHQRAMQELQQNPRRHSQILGKFDGFWGLSPALGTWDGPTMQMEPVPRLLI